MIIYSVTLMDEISTTIFSNYNVVVKTSSAMVQDGSKFYYLNKGGFAAVSFCSQNVETCNCFMSASGAREVL